MPTDAAQARAAFEAEFTKPPYEFSMARYKVHEAWSGNYRSYNVECAWAGFLAGRASARTHPATAHIAISALEQEYQRGFKAGGASMPHSADDTRRLDWLASMTVNVRVPLRYGSRNLFWASPDDEDGHFEPSDLREKIDKHMSPNGARQEDEAEPAVLLLPHGFLADVMTAAGLVSHGKQSKALSKRLGEAVMAIRAASPPPRTGKEKRP